MLQNINHFGSNCLIAQNHTPPTFFKWVMKLKMQASAGSARLFKTWKQSRGLFLILTYQRMWTPQTSLLEVEVTSFFLLKTFKLHMFETVWNSGKHELHSSLSPRSEGVSTWAPAMQPDTAADSTKKKINKNKKITAPEKGHPPLAFSSKLWGREGRSYFLPHSQPCFPLSAAQAIQQPQVLPENTFLAGRSNHTPELCCGHISIGSNAMEAVTARSWGQQE